MERDLGWTRQFIAWQSPLAEQCSKIDMSAHVAKIIRITLIQYGWIWNPPLLVFALSLCQQSPPSDVVVMDVLAEESISFVLFVALRIGLVGGIFLLYPDGNPFKFLICQGVFIVLSPLIQPW